MGGGGEGETTHCTGLVLSVGGDGKVMAGRDVEVCAAFV